MFSSKNCSLGLFLNQQNHRHRYRCHYYRKSLANQLVTLSRPTSSSSSTSNLSRFTSSSSITCLYLIGYFSRILVIFCFFHLVHSYPNCKCIKFRETYNKEYGIFTSPDWPTPYEPGIDCLLYIFMGQPDQLIEIAFDSFDVYASSTSNDCLKGDFVRIETNPQNSLVTKDDLKASDLTICGNSLADWQRQHFSYSNLLLLQFHSSTVSHDKSHGFSGTYRFLNRSKFQSDGHHLPGTQCDYQFLSISSTEGQSPRNGKFFSPNYPNRYPIKSQCAYHFMGKYNEKVKIVFEEIIFGSIDSSCSDTDNSISIYDGLDTNSPLLAQLCNDNRYVEIISSGPDLYMLFNSGSEQSPFAQGYRAIYSFNQTHISHGNRYHQHNHHAYSSNPSNQQYQRNRNKMEQKQSSPQQQQQQQQEINAHQKQNMKLPDSSSAQPTGTQSTGNKENSLNNQENNLGSNCSPKVNLNYAWIITFIILKNLYN